MIILSKSSYFFEVSPSSLAVVSRCLTAKVAYYQDLNPYIKEQSGVVKEFRELCLLHIHTARFFS